MTTTTTENINNLEDKMEEEKICSNCTDYLKKMAEILLKNPVAQEVVSSLLRDPKRLSDRRAYFDVDATTSRDMDETVSYFNHPDKLGIEPNPHLFSARYYEEHKVEICCGYAFPRLNWSERFGDIPEGRITRFKVAFIWFNRSNRRLTEEQLESEWNELYGPALGTWSISP